MKHLILTFLSLPCAASLLFSQAENPQPPAKPAPEIPGQPVQPSRPGQGVPGRPGLDPAEPQRPVRPFADRVGKKMYERISQMNEEEKKRIRKVIESVWNAESVKEARDKAWKAAQEYREALRAAVLQADPEVRPLLERLLMTNSLSQPGQPEQPRPIQPPFPGAVPPPQPPAVPGVRPHPLPQGRPLPPVPGAGVPQRPNANPPGSNPPQLGSPPDLPSQPGRPEQPGQPIAGERRGLPPLLDREEFEKLPEDRRRQLGELMRELGEREDIREARKALEEAPQEGKREAAQKLRRLTRAAIEEKNPELLKLIETIRGQRPEGRPERPEPQPEAPPHRPDVPAPKPDSTPGAPEDAPKEGPI